MLRACPSQRWLGSILRVVLAAVVATLVFLVGASPAAAAGLKWEAEIVFTLDTDAGRVRQTTTFDVTNTTPNTTKGYVTTRYYYDGVVLTIPNEAVGITVEGDRGGVTFEVGALGPPSDPFKEVSVDFNRNLFYRQTQSIVVGFDLVADLPRSDSAVRVNDAYASFGVYAFGDPESTVVKVIVEDRFDVELEGGNFTSSRADGLVTYTDDSIEDPPNYFVFVTARDDDRLKVNSIEIEDVTVTIKSWPNDRRWERNVTRSVTDGFSVLQQLTGLDWDLEDDLEIIEAFEPNLAGYGGWYIIGSDTIEIGEYASSHLVLHELSHAWFTFDLFGERWINEGLAEAYAEEAVARADLEALSDYERADEPSGSALFSFPLTEWEDLLKGTEGDVRREEYGYNTSSWVITTITDEIGFDQMRDVLAAADQNLTAYRGSVEPETVPAYDGWERLLDLVEELGGSETARELFEKYVITDDVDLDARYNARDGYHALQDAAGDHALPIYIRKPMSDWEFDVAEERIEEAHDVIDHAAKVSEQASSMDLAAPDLLGGTFSTTDSGFDPIHASLDTADEALRAIGAAEDDVAADHPFLTDIGLWGVDLDITVDAIRTDFEEGDFDAVKAGRSTLAEQLDDAANSGRNRAFLGGGGIAALLLLIAFLAFFLNKRRRRRVALVTEGTASIEVHREGDAPDRDEEGAAGPSDEST